MDNMRKYFPKYILQWLSLTIFCVNLQGASLVISQSGQYTVGDNITYTPSTSDQIIYINANNVVLDLNNCALIQSGGAGTLNGIEIASGVQNVTIQNGTIQGVSGAGVYINSGCREITIQNIQTYTANQGIVLNGTTNTIISDCTIKSTTIRYTTNQGILANNTELVSLDSILVDNCATTTFAIQFFCGIIPPLRGITGTNISINRCGLGFQAAGHRQVLLTNCKVTNCSFAGTFKGFYFSGTTSLANIATGISLQACSVGSSSGTGGSGNFTAFELTNITNSFMTNCTVNNCTGSGTTVRGYFIFQGTNIIINNCKTASLSSSNASPTTNGFEINSSNQVDITGCQTFNTGQGSSQGGFSLTSSTYCVLRSCIANTTATSSSGYVVSSSTQNLFNSCIASNCNSSGFNIATGAANNIFAGCNIITCATAFNIQNSSNLITNCIAQKCTASGFAIASGVSTTSIAESLATQCVNGFNNGSTASNLIAKCFSVQNSGTGFLQSVALTNNRYYNNIATKNTTLNYSAVVNNVVAAGGTPTMGCNNNG